MFSSGRELTKALRDTLARAALSRLFIDNGKLANQIARLVAIVVKCLFVSVLFYGLVVFVLLKPNCKL